MSHVSVRPFRRRDQRLSRAATPDVASAHGQLQVSARGCYPAHAVERGMECSRARPAIQDMAEGQAPAGVEPRVTRCRARSRPAGDDAPSGASSAEAAQSTPQRARVRVACYRRGLDLAFDAGVFRAPAPTAAGSSSSSSAWAASAAPWLMPPSASAESFSSAAFSSSRFC